MAKEEKTAAEIYRQERKARLAKAAKKNSKKSISSNASETAGRIIVAVIVLAIVVGVGAIVVNQSGIVPRNRTAFMVGDVKVSEAEYNYYYQNMYQNASSYVNYGYDLGFDTSKDPAAQDYSGAFGSIEGFPEDQTPTWADYFEYGAKRSIQSCKAGVAAAKDLEITLEDADLVHVTKTMDQYKQYADSASNNKDAKYSLSAYLKASFGKGMTKKLFKSILCDQELVEKLETVKTDEFKDTFSKKEIEAEYKNHITNFGVVDFRAYTFDAETVKVTSEDEKETEEVTDKTMAAAKAKADAFAAAVTSEDSFKTLASEAAKDAGHDDYKDYLTKDSLTLSDETSYYDLSNTVNDKDFLDWAFGTDTKANTTYVVEDKDSGYTVYFMVEPIHKAEAYYAYDSRHILINFIEDKTSEDANAEKSDKEETDAETTEAETTTAPAKEEVKVETLDTSKYSDVTIDLGVTAETAKNKKAYAKAQEILVKYLEGDRTAEAFAELANANSEDGGSNTNGGLYEGTKLGDFVPPYEEWCTKEGRKTGDVGIVEYEGSNYSGYHVIYYVDSYTVAWDEAVKSTLASEKFEEYFSDLLASDAAKITNLNSKLFSEVTEKETEAPVDTTAAE